MSRYAAFLARLKDYADLECLVADGRSYTYAELLAESEVWRQQLARLRVEPGTVVGIRADYSLTSIAVLLAVFANRAVAALIPRDGNVARYLQDAHASWVLELETQGAARWHTVDAPRQHELLDKLRQSSDGGVVIFTSGSTGQPKAALQSVERFLHKFDKPSRRLRTLAFLLFDHVAGLDTLFYTLSSGGALVVTRSRSPAAVCDLIARMRVEVLPASPSFLRLMCLAGNSQQFDLSSLKVITYGSEPMDPSTLSWVNARFPTLQVIQKYGTTETGSPRSVSRGNDSLWIRIAGGGTETRVSDGVLHLRGEGTILGYLNAPSPIDEDGWYCTGDLAEVEKDAAGEWIRICGRAIETINVGGEKASPAEIQQVILELPFVKAAIVRAEPHTMLGQIVTAEVVLESGLKRDSATKEIRRHCRLRLAPYKVPVKIRVAEGELVGERQKLQRTNTE